MEPYKIAGLIITILLCGFFAGIEIAFVSASKLSIELKKKQGIRSGKILARFIEQPARFIGTSLVGMTIGLVIYGILISGLLQPFWVSIGFTGPSSSYLKLLIEVVIAAFLILVLAQLIPRAVFRARADALLAFFAVPIAFFYRFLHPVAAFFVSISEWMLKYLFNVRIAEEHQVFDSMDLERFIKAQQLTPEAQELNTELFEKALYLVHIKIRECMIPRKEIEALEINTNIDVLKEKFIQTKLSKLIIYDDNIDNILGYVHQLDMYDHPAAVKEVLHPILAVPETMSATDLLNKFTQARKSIAWVVDEFGGTAGIVTLEDVLEEIFGDIKDEHDTEEFVEKQIAEREYIFSGRIELDHLMEKYGFDFGDSESETLSGFIISHHETIPKIKERIIIENFEFDVLNVTETRIEMVKMKLLK